MATVLKLEKFIQFDSDEPFKDLRFKGESRG